MAETSYDEGPYTVTETRDDVHIDHATSIVETVYDNPIEMAVWSYCHDCGVEYLELSTSLD